MSYKKNKKPLLHPKRLGGLTMSAVLALVIAPDAAAYTNKFADMSLEELANVEITSVSKKSERLADAPASVYVITSEDIRRSGATSLPEALRLAPNLEVSQASASGYAISARGQNGGSTSPNKLLVMIDGRSVYTPLFSGVFWDAQDVMLEDVERIEVISGPGGTLWGSNAVNGVINVITRSSRDTQGSLATASIGNRGNQAAFRHGGELGNGGTFRVYGKYSDHDHTETESGNTVTDAWNKTQVGFRADWDGVQDQVAVIANAYQGHIGQPEPGSLHINGVNPVLGDISISGINLTTNWTHQLQNGSSVNLQAYYDRTTRDVPPIFDQNLDIFDVQVQHTLGQLGSHRLVWGGGYRYGRDNIDNGAIVSFLPAKVNQEWINIFAQDEISLHKDLRLILGARVERNPYTGNEFLPNARLAWTPAEGHLLWTAASRTVRAPSRIDVDLFFPSAGPPYLLRGGPQVVSEVAKVYELGYRGNLSSRLSWSVTAFHNVYDHLRTQETNLSIPAVTFDSLMEGKSTGIETWGTYQVTRDWRLSAGMTMVDEDLHLKPGSNDQVSTAASGTSPKHTWNLRSAWNLTPTCQLDVAVRRVAALPAFDVPAYTAVDARLGWKLRRDLELAIVGQNLFGTQHSEYGPAATRSELPSSIAITLQWQL
jgi:iron complex outermembrane recepter protein